MRGVAPITLLVALVAGCLDQNAPARPYGYPQQQQGYYSQQGGPQGAGRHMHAHAPAAYNAGIAVTATAPAWMNDSYLGAPLDVNFQPYRGAGAAAPVFSGGAMPPTPVRQFETDSYQADKALELGANLSTWVVDVGVSSGSSTRYSSQRSRYVDSTLELNERSTMNRPPQGATWYVGKIYYGFVYEEIVFESDATFTASVAASFFSWGGDAHAFAQTHRLQERMISRGLTPKTGSAIFAHTPAAVQSGFTMAGGPPVPIMVEYRSIPNVTPSDAAIAWRP